MFEIFRFEIIQGIKSPVNWFYFVIVTFLSLFAVDFIYEGRLEPIKENAPYVVAVSMSVFSSFMMVICSLIMGMSILKDYKSNIQSLIFVNPVTKFEYLLGRFLGSFCILIFVSSGLFLGLLLSEFMPWKDADNMLDFNLKSYALPYVYLIIPTMLFSGIVFFISGALYRKLVVVYTQGVIFLMLYLLSLVLSRGIGTEILLSQIFDPFNIQTIKFLIHEWTINERNINQLIYSSYILYNRLFWSVMGICVFAFGYFRFRIDSFLEVKNSNGNSKSKKQLRPKHPKIDFKVLSNVTTQHDLKSKWAQFKSIFWFEFISILKEPLFFTLLVAAIFTLVVNSIQLDTKFGINSLPLTYLIVEQLNELTMVFFLMILVFYSGEIIWKERDLNVSPITHTFSVSDTTKFLGKFTSLIFLYLLLMMAMLFVGVIIQTLALFFEYNFEVYFMSLVAQNLSFLIMYTVMSMFVHVVVNNKYLGYITFIIFFLGRIAIDVFGLRHGLYAFAAGSLGMYSDMNGYGHTVLPFVSTICYWLSFSALLFIMILLLNKRGEKVSIVRRIKLMSQNISMTLRYLILFILLIFLSLGIYIFYNVNILNDFSFPSTENKMRAEYEVLFRDKFNIDQPQIVDVFLELDLYPESRSYNAHGKYKLVNKHSENIDQIIMQVYPNSRISASGFTFDRSILSSDSHTEYQLYFFNLKESLCPGDTLSFEFDQSYVSKGFAHEASFNVIQNGTFVNNDHFPSIGYNKDIELKDNELRKQYGLNENLGFNSISDSLNLRVSTNGEDGEFIDFETIISTSKNQIAVAPGEIVNSWNTENRSFYHYKMQSPMINFYDIVSAEYNVLRDQWFCDVSDTVALEIYYHNGHDYNIERMMKGMKSSLAYYTEAFGPYMYGHARIMEIPRYKSFAQSYPGTIPFSESIGFVMDIRERIDVDMAFFVTAHEMAHQWWGLQLVAADVEGHDFILESLSQYSAMMVLEKEYGVEKVRQFIRYEMKRYFQERSWSKNIEKSLLLVDDQEYVYYDKGALNLYALKSYIGEEVMNKTIQSFYKDWSSKDVLSKKGQFATSNELIKYFENTLPDSLSYLSCDLFENVIFYDNKLEEVNIAKKGNSYVLDLNISLKKFKADSMGNVDVQEGEEYFEFGFCKIEDGIEQLQKSEIVKLNLKTKSIRVELDFVPTKVILDPQYKLLDKDVDDNVFKVNSVNLILQ